MTQPARTEGYAHAPPTIRLGDLEVQRLGYGAMRLPGKDVWGEPDDPERARQRAHAAVDDPEGVLDLCTRKHIAYLPFFPLAVGKIAEQKPALTAIAEKHGASPAQIALAWLLARSPTILPIPGTSSVTHLEEN